MLKEAAIRSGPLTAETDPVQGGAPAQTKALKAALMPRLRISLPVSRLIIPPSSGAGKGDTADGRQIRLKRSLIKSVGGWGGQQ